MAIWFAYGTSMIIKQWMCLWLNKPVLQNRAIMLKMTSVHHSHFSFSHLLHNTNDSVCCGPNVYICCLHQYTAPVTYHSVLKYLHVDKAQKCHPRYMLYVLNSPQLWLPLFYVLYLNWTWGGCASCDLCHCVLMSGKCANIMRTRSQS